MATTFPIPNAMGIKWKQSENEDDLFLNIYVPLTLPEGARPKELKVTIVEGEVLLVKLKEEKVLQWRLHSQVAPEVEWSFEDGVLIMDLQKNNGSDWPSLLNNAVPLNNPAFYTEEELDALLHKEYKCLPPPKKRADIPEGDPDEVLEAALAEVTEENKDYDNVYVKAETKLFQDEEDEMLNKLKMFKEQVDTETDEEKKASAEKYVTIIEKMLDLSREIRRMRSQPGTVKNFLQQQGLDIRKARLNVSQLDEFETELYADEMEKDLGAHDTLKLGLALLQEQNIEGALHYFRLAAIHENDSSAAIMLYRIYSEMGLTPRAAYFLLKRANCEDYNAPTNLMVGELFDRGARHFPPLMAMALYYYQRAAMNGATYGMMCAAQLLLRGACVASLSSEEQKKANTDIEHFKRWIELAAERGSGSAYFVLGSMHLQGEHGYEKSYPKAKKFLELASSAQPEFLKKGPQMYQALEALRLEEEAAGTIHSPVKLEQQVLPNVNKAAVSSSQQQSNASAKQQKGRDAAGDRLAALSSQRGDARALMDKSSSKMAAAAVGGGAKWKSFWEKSLKLSIGVYAAYTLAFPLRLLALPTFYTVVGDFLEHWGGGSE